MKQCLPDMAGLIHSRTQSSYDSCTKPTPDQANQHSRVNWKEDTKLPISNWRAVETDASGSGDSVSFKDVTLYRSTIL